MSISERERHALGSIEDGLAGSDPALASMLAIFSALTSREEMPAHEKIRAARRAAHSPRRTRRPRQGTVLRQARRRHPRLDWQQAMLMLWLAISAGMIAVALGLSAGGHAACTQSLGMVCTG
jgi:hypothetical protein